MLNADALKCKKCGKALTIFNRAPRNTCGECWKLIQGDSKPIATPAMTPSLGDYKFYLERWKQAQAAKNPELESQFRQETRRELDRHIGELKKVAVNFLICIVTAILSGLGMKSGGRHWVEWGILFVMSFFATLLYFSLVGGAVFNVIRFRLLLTRFQSV